MSGIDFTPAVVIWVVLAIATLALALYRKLVSSGETDLIYLGPGEERHLPQQMELANKLKTIDHFGKSLTVITLAIGLIVSLVYLYRAFLVHN
jgi:hypothetical protein